jgi:hypothetical protein
MDTDHPAAHSMDTNWFAVDRDGHIALFMSREAGAVPLNAAASQSRDMMEGVFQVVSPGEVVHDPLGLRTPGRERPPYPHAWTAQYPVLLFTTSLEPFREALAAGNAVEVASTEGKAVILRNISDEELERYQKLPEFRGSDNLFFDEDEEGTPRLPAQYGIFEYCHLTENWISGPYGRERVPALPLHIDQLPPRLRENLGQLRLEGVRFTETPYLQPVEHTECASWESAWLDVTGQRIRPIPGKEEEYAEAYEEYYKDSSFEAEPPGEAAE